MSLQLRPDEMLTALNIAGHPDFPSFLDQLLSLSDAMAFAIVEVTPNVEATMPAEFWDGIVCAPIKPIDPSLPIPKHLEGLDDGGWE